jgi:hypothetical protein
MATQWVAPTNNKNSGQASHSLGIGGQAIIEFAFMFLFFWFFIIFAYNFQVILNSAMDQNNKLRIYMMKDLANNTYNYKDFDGETKGINFTSGNILSPGEKNPWEGFILEPIKARMFFNKEGDVNIAIIEENEELKKIMIENYKNQQQEFSELKR